MQRFLPFVPCAKEYRRSLCGLGSVLVHLFLFSIHHAGVVSAPFSVAAHPLTARGVPKGPATHPGETMHITASWGGAEVEVEVGEECRSLAALKQAVCSVLPEGVDGETVCLEVGGRAVSEEDVVGLSEGGRVDAVPTLAACAGATLREEGRGVTVEAFVDAAEGGDMRLCRLYLDAGVVCPRMTPLHVAVDQENLELCTLLLDRGGDGVVDVKNQHGSTALHEAVWLQNDELCTLLLDRGAAVNATDDDGETPLHTAVRQANKALCTLLLDRGGDVHAKNCCGDTPLHNACEKHGPEVCADRSRR